MANNIAGLGRFNLTTSAPGQAYVESIRQAGQDISSLGAGFAAYKGELSRREAEARSMIKDADFTKDAGPNSIFSADAANLRAKIDGEADDSYDFSNLNDIDRFNQDVSSLNREMAEFEEIYNNAVENAFKLEQDHNLLMAVGGDASQAPTIKIDGVGEVYNSKANDAEYREAMGVFNALRESEFVRNVNGSYTADGVTYDTKQDLLKAIVDSVSPDLKPVPIETPAEWVTSDKIANRYDTRSKAKEGIENYVAENPLKAKRWYAESKGISVEKVGEGESFNEDFIREALDEWQRQQDEEKPEKVTKTRSQTNLEDLSEGIGTVSLGGQTFKSGVLAKGKTQDGEVLGIYREGDGFGYVIEKDDGSYEYKSFTPSIKNPDFNAVRDALGLDKEDFMTLLKSIRAEATAGS